MWMYILTAVAAWVVWKVGQVLLCWRQRCIDVRGLPTIPDCHFLWGVLDRVSCPSDFMKISSKFVQEYRPRLWVSWVFIYPSVFVCHPSTLKQVLQASNVPKNASTSGAYRMLKPWLGDGLLISWGRKWERNRRLLTPAFHFDILKPYIQIYHQVSDIFLDKLAHLSAAGESVDVCPLVSRATLDTMLRCTLSYTDHTVQDLKNGHQHSYVEAVHRLGYLAIQRIINVFELLDQTYSVTPRGREFKRLCRYVHNLSAEIIQTRRALLASDPTQVQKRHLDFLDILITARDGSGAGLTDQEIRDEVDTFMFEGHDTTASAIFWALYALAKYPEMQEKVREEIKCRLDGDMTLKHDNLSELPYTTCFIKETMRMYSPVPAVNRQLVEPLIVDGRTFPVGTVIEIHPYLVHHHPDVWADHMEFRPERFTPENTAGRDPFAFIPFSAGPRNCIGQNFALNEIKVILSRTVTRFRLTVDPKREPEICTDVVMRAKDGIYLHFEELTT